MRKITLLPFLILLLIFIPLIPMASEVLEATPLKQGETAPFDGVLIPPEKLKILLAAKAENERLKAEIELLQSKVSLTRDIYEEELREIAKPPNFWIDPERQRWIGFVLGVFVTGGAVWGAGQLD